MPSHINPKTPLPFSFTTKKTRILESISVPDELYSDKSPKGSIDAPIVTLIDEINAIDGVVTTSSCSGRVAVFVEGATKGVVSADADAEDEDREQTRALTGGPAGKGGGRWLYVSHDPVSIPSPMAPEYFTRLCGLSRPQDVVMVEGTVLSPPRLIKLSFSPLILHILCATLAHAKPLLAAAINAGFRESGVQSLKALDDPEAGVMVGIRTMGLGFETVVGRVEEVRSEDGLVVERCRALVSDEYLGMMFEVVNERFVWNDRRKERLMAEIRGHFGLGAHGGDEWEDAEVRRRRKREEGLRRKREVHVEKKGPLVRDENMSEVNMEDMFDLNA